MLSKKAVFDELVWESFRLHGELMAAGDELVADLGLTSARWQVVGAIAKAKIPPSISDVARIISLSRQAVRRVVNDLVTQGLVEDEHPSSGRRLRKLALTSEGRAAHAAADARQVPWAEEIIAGMDGRMLMTALETLRDLRARLAR